MVQHFTVPQKTVMNACFHSDNLLPTGNGRLVQALLAAGADPCIKDLRGKSAYDCSQNQQIRNIFRRFAGRNPSKWPYSKANIVPLTKEMENRRALKRKKKKKTSTPAREAEICRGLEAVAKSIERRSTERGSSQQRV